MRGGDEARKSRRSQADLAAALDRVGRDDGSGSVALVVRTVSGGAYPAVAGSTFAVQVVDVSGVESEGTAPTLTVRAGVFHCVVLGSAVPPVGTDLLATQVGGRWAARWD